MLVLSKKLGLSTPSVQLLAQPQRVSLVFFFLLLCSSLFQYSHRAYRCSMTLALHFILKRYEEDRQFLNPSPGRLDGHYVRGDDYACSDVCGFGHSVLPVCLSACSVRLPVQSVILYK